MTYRELLLQAKLKLDYNDITLGEFEQMIAPLNREVDMLDKIRVEVEQLKYYKAQFLTSDNKVCIDSQEVLDIIDKYK